jgi:hypothetical protein
MPVLQVVIADIVDESLEVINRLTESVNGDMACTPPLAAEMGQTRSSLDGSPRCAVVVRGRVLPVERST